jgi:hypothetical protein
MPLGPGPSSVCVTIAGVLNLTSTQIALGAAGLVTFVGYCVFIFAPAWASYGRTWERIAAGFLSLFILAAMVGIGIGIGVAGLYLYLQNV